MKIRRAVIQDFDRIMEMMVNFANSSPLEAHRNPQYEDMYVRKLLCEVIKNGCLIVGEHNDRIEGMLIAYINTDVWLPSIRILREWAWWVEEDYRHTSLGYKLLKKYIEYGTKMKDAGVIDEFMLTMMEISPELGLEKRGWSKVEHNFVYQGV